MSQGLVVTSAKITLQEEPPMLRRIKFIHILSLLMMLISGGGGLAVLFGNFPPEIKGSIITLMLIGGWTDVRKFWLTLSNGNPNDKGDSNV